MTYKYGNGNFQDTLLTPIETTFDPAEEKYEHGAYQFYRSVDYINQTKITNTSSLFHQKYSKSPILGLSHRDHMHVTSFFSTLDDTQTFLCNGNLQLFRG